MRAPTGTMARVLRVGVCAVAISLASPWAMAQQARQPAPAAPAPAPARVDAAAPCFSSSDPAAIEAACDLVVRADRGLYSADQTGLALQRRGGARVSLGRIDDAIADFRQMATAGYRAHEAHASIGSLEFRRQRLREAETSYREALRVNPSYALAHIGLGHTLIGLGRAVEATLYFDRALATSENDVDRKSVV